MSWCKYLLFVTHYNETWIFATDFQRILNITFDENPSSGSQVATWCCQTYRHTHDKGNKSLFVMLWMWLKLALIMWGSISREVDNPNLCKTRGNIPMRQKFSSSKVLCEESQELASLLFLLLPVKKFNA